MIEQPRQHVGEPSIRVDIIELRGCDEGVDGRRPSTALVGACECLVATPDRDGAQFALCGIVRHAEAPIVKEARQRRPALEAVIDGLPSIAVLGHPGALFAQPTLQFDDECSAPLLAHLDTLLRRHAVNLTLDGEQGIEPRDRLCRDRRLVDARQIEKLTSCVGTTGSLDDRARFTVGVVQPVEPGVSIGLHQSGEARQMPFGMLTAAIARIEEHRGWRIRPGKGPIVAHIGP